jgi:tRNA pseudouridine13 synthase
MKDRHGVTSQWFSVALQEARDSSWQDWEIPDAVILAAHLHNRKLKRGALRGNRFRIVVRQLEGRVPGLEDRLQIVKAQGVPNYFGPQRFGHGGRNVSQGVRWLEHGGRLPRNKKSIYLSSVRSYLFNKVLSRRVDLGNWNRIVDGDIASLDGSHSTFPCRMPDQELTLRCEQFDIHPSGPLPDRGGSAGVGEAAEIEGGELAPHEALVRGLVLEFELSSGGYATSVLRELVTTGPVTISESG